jgi:molybdopterin-containing oxidoreductase family iron-sulfur binding subunit
MKPGDIEYYHTIAHCENTVYGLDIKLIDGKPILIEGNRDFYGNWGSIAPNLAAELYHLYSPDRFFKPKNVSKNINLDQVLELSIDKINSAINEGKSVYFFTRYKASPSLIKMISAIEAKFPSLKFIDYKGVGVLGECNNALKNNIVGTDSFENIDCVISLFNDIYGSSSRSCYYSDIKKNNRCKTICVSDCITNTYLLSDEKYSALRISEENIVKALKNILYNNGVLNAELGFLNASERVMVEKLAECYRKAKSPLLICSENASIETVLNTMCINDLNSDVSYYSPLDDDYQNISVNNYIKQIDRASLCILMDADYYYSNQMYDKYLKNIDNKSGVIYLGNYMPNELKDPFLTIPVAHFLESWGDGIALNGDYAIQQPVINKLNENSISQEDYIFNIFKSLGVDLLQSYPDYYSFIKSSFAADKEYEETLVKGLKNNEIQSVRYSNKDIKRLESLSSKHSQKNYVTNNNNIYLVGRVSQFIRSYRDYKNPWLREMKSPINSSAYINYLEINTNTANKYHLKDGDFLELKNKKKQSVTMPVILNNQTPENVVVGDLYYGYDQDEFAGYCIDGLFDDIMEACREISISKSNRAPIEIMPDRNKISDYKLNYLKKLKEIDNFTNYKGYKFLDKHWGLIVDLDKCVACGACLIACKTENNVPNVGAKRFAQNRDMDWISLLRIDNYKGRSVFIPYMCQHCDAAPCETACPVNASTHSPEGLNETTYNRCIGTRYCMAACQYKVRKFNFGDYHENYPESLKSVLNPNVTVRSRGVVEKCSLCVQRLNKYSELNKSDQSNMKLDTACSRICPTGAISLVDLNSSATKEFFIKEAERLRQIIFNASVKPSVYYLLND